MTLERIRGMSDVDALARIIEAEAASEPLAGKVAVGAVIDNRRRSGRYGEGWKGVITKPGQFSAINDVTGYAGGQGANRMFWQRPGEESLAVARAIVNGKYDDPTGGATHYFNPKIANPKWKNDTFRPIGNHVFGNAEAGRASGGNDTLGGGEGEDDLRSELIMEAVRRGLISRSELEAEASRRGLLGGQAQRVAAEGPSQQDRADVENALNQLEAEDAPEKKGLVEGAFDEFTSGVVGNFGDELTAFEGAIPALFNDDNFMEQYQILLSEEREKAGEFREQNPITAAVANVGGAVSTGVGLARSGATLINGTRSVAGAIGAGALEGSIYGAIYGAGAAEGDDVIEEALESGAAAALLGGVLAGGVQKISNVRARSAAVRALKPVADLKAARDQAYETVSKLGLTYRTPATDNLVDKLSSRVGGQAFNERLHTGTAAVLKYAETLKGKSLSMTDLDQLRQIAARDAGSSTVAADRKFASEIIEEIDDFIASTSPRGSANAGPGRRAILEARRAHSTFKKAELIDNLLIEAADAAAATGSGGNINNQIRQRFKNLLRSEKKRRGFSSEELGIIRRIVRGSKKDNVLRLVGKLSPGGNGLMMALNVGAIATNPALAGVTVAGTAAKELADRGTQRAVTGLQSIVSSGDDATRATVEMTAQKRALLRALAVDLGVDLTVEGSSPRIAPGQ